MNVQMRDIVWDEFQIMSDLLSAAHNADPSRTFLYCWEEAAYKYLAEHWKSGTINGWAFDRLQDWKVKNNYGS